MSTPIRKWKDSKTRSTKKGKWTEKEIDHLKRLLCKYANRKNWTADQLASICSDTTPSEFNNVWTKLAKFFPERSVQSLHNICKRHFNPFNYKGAWTMQEERTLIEFVEKNGKKWLELGELLQRTALNVKDKWKQMGGIHNKLRKTGAWSAEETKELLRLIMENVGVKDKKLEKIKMENADSALYAVIEIAEKYKKEILNAELSWETIAEIFKTRSSVDCRTRWSYIMNYKVPERMTFEKDDDIEIFKGIRKQGVKNIEEIDFSKISNGKAEEDNKFRFKVLAKAMSGRLRLSLNEILEKLERSYDIEYTQEPTIIDYYLSKYPDS